MYLIKDKNNRFIKRTIDNQITFTNSESFADVFPSEREANDYIRKSFTKKNRKNYKAVWRDINPISESTAKQPSDTEKSDDTYTLGIKGFDEVISTHLNPEIEKYAQKLQEYDGMILDIRHWLRDEKTKLNVCQIGTKTELGKYSSKYALTELLVCGECGTAYRRCTWTASGNKKIVWRCINRLDFGKKYCHESPTIEEGVLQRAIMDAIKTVAMQNSELLPTLKTHIAMNMECDNGEDRSLEIKVRLAEIDREFQKLLNSLSVDLESNANAENAITELMIEKRALEQELVKHTDKDKASAPESKLNEISHITQILENQPLKFDDTLIRQILECVVVQSKEQIKVIFKDGTEVDQPLD